ncbi:hypothetical protein PG993_013899 [Apiospora rasikravindrae]|uniref:DUF221-domain-containing protein n=1 Tax=Apiospora rasikravindrae TaxID=990691 RepID=A0ABR1RRM6_9PEZI
MAGSSVPGVLPRDGAEDVLQYLQNPFNTELTTNAFWSSFGYSIGAAFAFYLLFCLLRPYNKTVYAPRLKHSRGEKHAPPPLTNGVFGWVNPVLKTRDQVLVEKIGQDATIFLRFIKMSRNIMIVLSVIGCGVYLPLNIIENGKAPDATTNVFMKFSPRHLDGDPVWVHVVVSYVFDIVICFFLWSTYRAVTRIRREYFESSEYQSSLHARTLMVVDIPKSYRSDDGVARLVDEVDTTGDPTGIIARSIKGLPELIEKHEEAVRELEAVLAKYLKNPDKLPAKRPKCKAQKGDEAYAPGSKVDAIDYLTSRINKLATKIHEARKAIGNREVLPYGFASFPNIDQAHELAYAARNKHPKGSTLRLAPRPSDLIWKNLPLDKKTRNWRNFMNNVWVGVLTAIWTIPNAGIAIFLADLSKLGSLWPAFQTQLAANPRFWGAMQGILAPVVTTLFYLVLPTIFRRLSIYAGNYSKTERERHVTHKLYIFFIFNNLIVFSLFSAGWKYGLAVLRTQQKNDFDAWTAIKATAPGNNLMIAFCDVSPFWLNYLLQRNFGAALDISQLSKLAKGWLSRKLLSPTPRELIELTAPPPFDYASYYNNFLFYITIALIFAPFQPLVLPVTAFYFAMDAYLKKYLLMYVFVTKHESGGEFWRMVFNRVLSATLLANIVAAIFVVSRKNHWIQFIMMGPLLLLLLGFKIYCMKTFDDDQTYYSKGDKKRASDDNVHARHKGEKVGVRFGHPALYRKLMVPMVHSRAQHILKDIYRGRLDTGFDDDTGYGDSYRMQNMAKPMPGQIGGSTAPFELVSDSQMDFEHFRNRTDFHEQAGDSGSIYSRSMADTPGGTPYNGSRSGSPAPSYFKSQSGYDTDKTAASTPDGDVTGMTYPAGYFAAPTGPAAPGRSPLARSASEEELMMGTGHPTPSDAPHLGRTTSHSPLL